MINNNELDSSWHEWIVSDCEEICKDFGIGNAEVNFSGFGNQGDGACVFGRLAYTRGMTVKIKAKHGHCDELMALANQLNDLFKKSFYTLDVAISRRYSDELSMRVLQVSDIKGRLDEDEVLDWLRDLSLWIYKALECEYEYQLKYQQEEEPELETTNEL